MTPAITLTSETVRLSNKILDILEYNDLDIEHYGGMRAFMNALFTNNERYLQACYDDLCNGDYTDPWDENVANWSDPFEDFYEWDIDGEEG